MDQRERLRTEIDRATVSLVDKVQELEERAVELKTRLRQTFQLSHHVEERPWTVVGIAVGVGFAIGYLTR